MDYIEELRKLIGTRPLIMCGANVIIVNEENEILLHHRTDKDWWGLPGGAMELGESLEETAKREVYEEINIKCEELELYNVYSGKELFHIYPDGNQVYNVTITYLCYKYSGEIIVDKIEGIEAKFFKCDKIPNNLATPIIPILSEYIKSLK